MSIWKRERDLLFTPAKPVCGHMAATLESGMSLRLRVESKVQAGRPFYLTVVQLFIKISTRKRFVTLKI